MSMVVASVCHTECSHQYIHTTVTQAFGTLNVPPINLLSLWIISTILVVLHSFVGFFIYFTLFSLFMYLFILCLCFLTFFLSLFQSIGVAGVCMLCLSWPSTQRVMTWHCTNYCCLHRCCLCRSFVTTELVSLGRRISADTGCAGCRRVERTV